MRDADAMGKYDGLSELLRRQSGSSTRMTFEQIADVVPGGLPASAHRYPAWWANESDSPHVQAHAWMDHGWRVAQLDLVGRVVTFVVSGRVAPAPLSRGTRVVSAVPSRPARHATMDAEVSASGEAFAKLAAFLTGGRFNAVVSELEHALLGTTAITAGAFTADAGLDSELLAAALLVRKDIGRVNDLIHAAVISLTLPMILEPGERVTNRPSLAAGNDPTRMYDLETDRRVAEFKMSVWSGTDAMRKRGVFQDLVHLAADNSGRRPELYVAGTRPLTFLRGSRSTAAWGLNRGADSTRQLFLDRFGSLAMPIREFTAGPAAHVHLVDLGDLIPQVRAATGG